ncbi:MAG: dependent oxidoreductase [Symbiobacteriaceae bacterium]|jgi:flavin-dependent dehydrogenase|nr:dependent oxidoreductase [Symbiobacteriaceae bacterium]
MRIAIVGAGLAGLACAHELERLGLAPDVFEKGPCVGNRSRVVELMTQFMHVNPRQDIWGYVRDELMLPLEAAFALRRCVVHSASHEAEMTGKLGYVTIRGDDDGSLERQLARHVEARVRFGQTPDVRELRREYDWVVVATGDQRWTTELSQWKRDLGWTARGALVTGNFAPGEAHFFFDTRYAGTGHALLAPLDEHTAIAGIGLPDASPAEAEAYWERFRASESFRWDVEKEPFEVCRNSCGEVWPVVVGNVLLTGVAGGFLEPLGMNGQCPSLTSGVMAARQIALRDPWLERFARRWRVYYRRLARLRRSVNAWTDEDMDRLTLGVKYGGWLVTHSPWNLLEPSGMLADVLRLADELPGSLHPLHHELNLFDNMGGLKTDGPRFK